MSDVTITHTAAEGTLIDGIDRDDRDVHAILKASGWRYSRNVGWYVRNSRDRNPNTAQLDRVAEQIRATGRTVTLDIDTTARPTAEREAHRAEQAGARADALAAKADRLSQESDRRLAKAHEMADAIPFGQPMLTDHYSYKSDRRYRDRIHDGYEKGFELARDAEEEARRAQAAANTQEHRLSAPATIRRIGKLKAERRLCERRIHGDQGAAVEYHGAPASGGYLERLEARIVEIDEEVTYWQAHLTSLEASGVKLWGPWDFQVGDRVEAPQAATVQRVNKKSLSLVFDVMPMRARPVPYDKVRRKLEA